MSKGFPFETFAAVLDVTRDTLYQWSKAHKEFSQAKKRARDKSYLFFVKEGLDAINKPPQFFNTTVWIFMMKNIHQWRDTVSFVDHDDVEDVEFEDVA